MRQPDLSDIVAKVQRQWRQWRRVHAARTLSERRLLVLAMVALTWFVVDFVLVTPSYKRFSEAQARVKKANGELQAKQAEATRYQNDMQMMTAQLQSEVDRIRKSVAKQHEDLEALQGGLVPAREMRGVLEGLLERGGSLRLISMKTLSPQEGQRAGAAVPELAGLYRHGLEVTLQGGFNDLLQWQKGAEQLPRKLLWSGMQLAVDEQHRVALTVRLFTLSPDIEPLEISPP